MAKAQHAELLQSLPVPQFEGLPFCRLEFIELDVRADWILLQGPSDGEVHDMLFR